MVDGAVVADVVVSGLAGAAVLILESSVKLDAQGRVMAIAHERQAQRSFI